MLTDVKKKLIENPDVLKKVLEDFDYHNVIIHNGNYISCGRDESSSKKSIVIHLKNNEYLWVQDYPLNISSDIFSYIISQKHRTFSEIINVVKNELGIDDFYSLNHKKGIFNGFYSNIRSLSHNQVTVYDPSIMNHYSRSPNFRFTKDRITFNTQKKFNIAYDIESQSIVIPIFDPYGQIMGIKARINKEAEDGEQKYFYLVPCSASNTLYGYSQNYQYLSEGTILIGEAEKFVMQCDSYGIHNAVSLMSGSLSVTQAKLICELRPRKVIFCHDVGYDYESIKRNIKILKSYSRFSEFEIGYWAWKNTILPDKASPTDFGVSVFNNILKNEIIIWEG